MSDFLRISRDGDVAIVTVDNPPVNALSFHVREPLMQALVELRDHRGAASFWVERRFVTEVLRRDPARTQANVLHDDSWQAQLRREWDRQEREKQAQPRDLPLRAGEE